jgi:hypothetical protein
MGHPLLRRSYEEAAPSPSIDDPRREDRDATFASMNAADLLLQLLALPVKDRAMLAHELLKSLRDDPDEDDGLETQSGPQNAIEEIDEEWEAELERRDAELDNGTVQGIPLSEFTEAVERRRAERAKR